MIRKFQHLHSQHSQHFFSSHHASFTTARLDFDWITSNVSLIKKNIQERKVAGDPLLVAELYQTYRNELATVETRRRERNDWATQIPQLQGSERESAIACAKNIKIKLHSLESCLKKTRLKLQKEGLKLPNTTHKDTPVGSEDAAVVVSQFGTMPMFHTFDHGPQDHVHLCELHDLVDFQAATTITGPKVRRKIIIFFLKQI